MPSFRILFLFTVIAPGVAAQLTAQGSPPAIGSPVRLVAVPNPRVVHTGKLLWLVRDNVVMITAAGDTVRTTLGDSLRVDLPIGQTSKAGTGAIIGLVAGGVTGFALGAALYQDGCTGGGPVLFGTEPSQICLSKGGASTLMALLGGGAGALVGALVGSNITRPVWGALDAPTVRPLAMRQPSGGIALGVAVGF